MTRVQVWMKSVDNNRSKFMYHVVDMHPHTIGTIYSNLPEEALERLAKWYIAIMQGKRARYLYKYVPETSIEREYRWFMKQWNKLNTNDKARFVNTYQMGPR